MTEQTMTAVPPEADEPPARNRRLLAAGALAAALVFAAGGYLLLGGGGGSNDAALGLVPHKARAVAVAKKRVVVIKAKPATVNPTASKENLGRDPFKALYVAAVSTAVGGTGATGTGTTGTGTTGTGTTGTGTTGTGTTGTGTTGTGTTGTPSSVYALTLKAVSKPNPEIRFFLFDVGGDSKTVIAGQRFGKHGELLVLAYTKSATGQVTGAVIQVGDDNPLQMRIGDKISVL